MNGIYAIKTDMLADKNIFARWYDKMPDCRQKKIDSIKPEEAKRLSLGAGIVLDAALSDFGISEYELEILDGGKPHLKGRSDIFFSLSHSADMAVCAISDGEVGADIERIREFDDRLISYVFNENEISYVRENAADRQMADEMYTRLWTVKESVMKYFGRGISMEPAKIHVSQGKKLTVSSEYEDCSGLNFFSQRHEEKILTICSKYNNFTKAIIFMENL